MKEHYKTMKTRLKNCLTLKKRFYITRMQWRNYHLSPEAHGKKNRLIVFEFYVINFVTLCYLFSAHGFLELDWGPRHTGARGILPALPSYGYATARTQHNISVVKRIL
ncbi:hypothetical protein PYW08_006575 [Mythimna loreyi]|uniref:Uncharacterized protein n=1 Tax=Mythimna loreyi TaxID=667449 RepID=A0ACC2QS45_9NEOP|nr:hypothetical protein PYW08_006575 [Mythimna loreyi]